MTETVLDRILTTKRAEVAEAKAARALPELLAVAHAASPPRPFRAALEAKVRAGGFALIAEIKRASPSKGLIRADFDPPALARAYAEGGAGALSILTDGPYFQGAPDFLVGAREAVALPCLRKDFMIDPYQVVEARAMGADAILVIMAAVDDDLAQDLTDAAHALGMDVLAEVHNGRELDRALALEPDLLGINNRDLKTFVTTLEVTERLAPFVPDGTPVVTESGIASHADLVRLAAVGVNMCLVGESLMRQDDVATATRTLLGG